MDRKACKKRSRDATLMFMGRGDTDTVRILGLGDDDESVRGGLESLPSFNWAAVRHLLRRILVLISTGSTFLKSSRGGSDEFSLIAS